MFKMISKLNSVGMCAVVATGSFLLGQKYEEKIVYAKLLKNPPRFRETVSSNYVLSYNRYTRSAHWVCEHLTQDRLVRGPSVDRKLAEFLPDKFFDGRFIAKNEDYLGSGYDRGHLVAAGNHRQTQKATNDTFHLSNISPQKEMAKTAINTYILTGPLYLPREEPDGNKYVKYRVIGNNNVAVPTHFFKVLLLEKTPGKYEVEYFMLANEVHEDSNDLKNYHCTKEAIEKSAGLSIFDKLPPSSIKKINRKEV
ncbi:unnamed protein product [Caenorhabditis auriculariae]|uniref:Endonuclease n=1 Tax=Caenorhabditis auriculariae TaxID=2777116 RepID=A0A8S1HCB0_9PELO|nr:unnamed protein product [Caenorhabditis auriculariae]